MANEVTSSVITELIPVVNAETTFRLTKILNLPNLITQKDISKVSIYSRYVSILAVGLQKDINSLVDYTVYQLKDEFKRFQLKQDFDIYLRAKLAGAKDLDEVDNWMDDIHP